MSKENGNGKNGDAKEPIIGPGQKVLSMEERELPCRLSSEEVIQRADTAAKVAAAKDSLIAEKKRMSDEINGRIKAEDGKLKLLFRQITSRSEDRLVTVALVPDYKNGIVRVKRQDTKQVVETREMRQHERQPVLEAIAGGKDDPKEKSKRSKKPKLAAVAESASTA